MKRNIKLFIELIYKDFLNNLDVIIPLSIFSSGVLIVILISLGIINFEAIFWFLGLMIVVFTLRLIWWVLGDIIKYIKITWRKSKQGKFEK